MVGAVEGRGRGTMKSGSERVRRRRFNVKMYVYTYIASVTSHCCHS